MKIEEFIVQFTEEFEMTESSEITPETEFKVLDEWDSLLSLSIIGMVQNSFKVKINGKDINSTKTVQELFDLIQSRM